MTEANMVATGIQETRASCPCVSSGESDIILHKEGYMSKIGCFIAGIAAGATALAVTACLVDNAENKQNAIDDDAEEQEGYGATDSDPSVPE